MLTELDSTYSLDGLYSRESCGLAWKLWLQYARMYVAEIANVSLDLLSAVTHFKIRHRPHQQLQLRVGPSSHVVCYIVAGPEISRAFLM